MSHAAARGQMPDERAPAQRPEEGEGRIAETRCLARHEDGEEHREQRDGRRVVEQALALDEASEARRRADVAEDADDRDRICRGDDGADKQA